MRILRYIAFIFITVCIYICVNLFSSYVFPWQKKEAIQTALNWGGLNSIPKNAENVAVKKHGTIFTRTFVVKFTLDKPGIQNWINSSKRLKSNHPKINHEKEIYKIYPGENNSFGGIVEIYQDTVQIKMSWG